MKDKSMTKEQLREEFKEGFKIAFNEMAKDIGFKLTQDSVHIGDQSISFQVNMVGDTEKLFNDILTKLTKQKQ